MLKKYKETGKLVIPEDHKEVEDPPIEKKQKKDQTQQRFVINPNLNSEQIKFSSQKSKKMKDIRPNKEVPTLPNNIDSAKVQQQNEEALDYHAQQQIHKQKEDK